MTGDVALLLTVAGVWAALEGRTILVAAMVWSSCGAERLDRLGWGFLLTESWTLVVLGLVHGVVPTAVHHVYTAAPWAPTSFVAGWMIRDLGLWLRRRPSATWVWTFIVTTGALAQAIGTLALVVTAGALGPEAELGGGAGLLVLLDPPVLVIGGLLQWWWHRQRVERDRRATCHRTAAPQAAVARVQTAGRAQARADESQRARR